MANQVYVVIEMADKVVRDVVCGSASVPDELPLGHLVFDVRTGEIDGQQDQTVAQDVHGVCGDTTTRGRTRRSSRDAERTDLSFFFFFFN